MTDFQVGSLVHARGREWVVLPSADENLLMLRPLGGSEAEICGIYLPIERDIHPASFPRPNPSEHGDLEAGQLLHMAARFNLRNGAGPFRSFGLLNIRPRPYQLVPLIMALRYGDPAVRLLIADDVGIGKTIEAGLIARELLDRNMIQRLAVVCPPHLCEQWQRELKQKFSIDAVIMRSSTIAAIERKLPQGSSLLEYYPFVIASIDYIKSEKHKASFIQHCPEFVIVDEAHTATENNNQQQRFDLVRKLADDPKRHMVLLTATPHSGIEDAFKSLLGLLNTEFLKYNLEQLNDKQRQLLARHFVQRRRADVRQWLGKDDQTPFPEREVTEISYRLQAQSEYYKLYHDVYSYTKELIPSPTMQGQRQRAHYWAALALLRCVMSSPAAAEKALSAHASSRGEGEVSDQDQALSDSDADALYQDDIYETNPSENPLDVEPSSVFSEAKVSTRRIRDFAMRAGKLKGKNDPKLQKLVETLKALLKDDYNPIVYCRYIATANYLGDELPALLKEHKIKISVVTGERSEEEREEAINKLEKEPRRLLIATDCMSEGINLQQSFDAVVHYDLPWNPNRLEQREGRIDRYGQSRDNVRAVLLYGENNPIDQAVMKVLVRKARSIYRSLGISVPLPLEDGSVLNTMINELFANKVEQLTLFDTMPNLQLNMAEELELKWQSIAEREKQSRSRFAQLSIKPEEVANELAEIDQVLGDPDELETFMRINAQRLNFSLEPYKQHWRMSIDAKTLDPLLAARLRPIFGIKEDDKNQSATLQVSFDPKQLYPKEVELIGRNHPLVSNLAEYLLDQALSTHGKHDLAARSAMIRTNAVASRTVLLLLRVRLLIKHRGNQSTSLAEELVICGLQNQQIIDQDQAIRLFMNSQPSSNTEQQERLDTLQRALNRLDNEQLKQIAEQRAEHLRKTYNRLSASLGGSAQITPHLPPDIWGIYVLMPALH